MSQHDRQRVWVNCAERSMILSDHTSQIRLSNELMKPSINDQCTNHYTALGAQILVNIVELHNISGPCLCRVKLCIQYDRLVVLYIH